jgi:hypothetical protein
MSGTAFVDRRLGFFLNPDELSDEIRVLKRSEGAQRIEPRDEGRIGNSK